ncbi:hypothetical protein [Seonamhaeicola marinus]|uniref:Cytochrome b561 bacterial/Ni-hydrogenase domain-containing protein n=1 Tax=Seonamhaeicola marinus TaxID=1912246 RepID=A0A5D0I477_9FLAO|nr:hypothetical protein [Seonamhaeicola marinus]TYA78513.1 hypothetical protein FUA24_09150 [Seonamhaeicola marinus]
MVLSNNKSTVVGLILFAAFILQLVLKLEWTWLLQLQQEEMYKRWSGLLLTLVIAFQWLLSVVRTRKRFRQHIFTMQNIHKWVGALSPVIFYIHTMHFGYGYLLLLSYIFFANTILGYFNLDVIKNNSDALFKGWMIAHVALSLIITILMVFHVVMVFYYK